MIKVILKFIIVPLLVIIYGVIFWQLVAPNSYLLFWNKHPRVAHLVEDLCPYCAFGKLVYTATSSELVNSEYGKILHDKEIWPVKVANNEESRVRGLSNKSFLDRQTGLLFAFDDMDHRRFWMKDMLIYIDMIFIDENWEIVLIEENLSPSSFPKVFGDKIKSKYVLELNGGEAKIHGMEVGDRLIYLNE